jgi:O-acetyl-ADP-ribose deacetylase (regulator of RNase III)
MAWHGRIHFVEGDATYPTGEGNKIIVHVCNDIGLWGAGFTGDLTERWMRPQIAYFNYHQIHDTDKPMELGTVIKVKVEDDIWVANLIGERGFGRGGVVPPMRYEAVRKGLVRVARMASELGATVHMPKIGCGLAGGNWEMIEPIITETICRKGINVIVYSHVVTVASGDY